VALRLPSDIRVDSGVEAGDEVTPYYDAMIAKLIAHAPTREAALDRLTAALDRTLIVGPRSNVALLAALTRSREFRQGRIDTGYIDRSLAALGAVTQGADLAAAAFGVERLLIASSAAEAEDNDNFEASSPWITSPWAARDGFQLGGTRSLVIPIVIDGESADAAVCFGHDGARVLIGGVPAAAEAHDNAEAFTAGDEIFVLLHGRQTRVRLRDFSVPQAAGETGDGIVKAPMHGKVLELFVRAGDRVVSGQRLAVIEAMKMEHTLNAPFAGVVVQISAAAGAQVVEGAHIMVIEPAAKR
jgi:3-methylcrotonyl-CoA carboxylase alpha subunit